MVLITVVKITIVACTFIGNLFVIIAILIDKNLQTPANQLVLSLAVADLMVACLVMPLGTYNDYHDGWWLGKEVCEFWTSADVLCCTASILNLLAIALDRYWAVTNVDYIYKRTRKRVNLMILCAWTVGAIVSLAPIFGWKDPDFARRVLEEHKCLVSQDVAYQIFATISTFYAPLVLLLALYWRIFKVARKRIHCKPGGKLATVVGAATQQQQHRKHHQEKQTVATTSNLIIRGAASGPFSKQKGLLSAVAPRSTHQSGGSMASLVTTEPEHKKQQPPPSSSSLTTSASQTSQHDHHQLQPSKVLVVQNDEPSRSPSVVVVTGSAQLAAQPDQKSIAQRGTPHLACEEAPYATGGSPLASLAADSREARNVSLTGACLTGDDEAQLQLAQPERDANNFKPFGGTRGGTKQDNDYEDEEEKKKKTVASSIVAPATAQIGVDSGGGSSTQDSAKLTTLTTNDIFTGSTTCAGGGGGQSDATERCPATAARASRHQREETKEEEQTGRRLKGDGGARFASVCLATNKSVDGFMLKNKERQCRGTQFAAVPVQQQQQQLSQASSNCRQEGARCFSSLAADAASGELNSAVVASMNEKRICLPMNNNNRNHHHQKQQQHRTSCTRDSGHKLDVDDEQATREALVSAVARPASGVGSTNDQRRNDCQDRQCSSNQRRSSLVLQADQFLCSSFSMRSHNHNNNYSPTTTRPSTTAQATTTCATARLTSGAPPLAEMATKTTQMEQRRAPSDANEVLKLLRCTPLASLAAGRQARQEQFTSRTINSRGEPANEQANNRVSSREPGLGMVLAKYDDDDDDDDDVTARGRAGSEGCSGKSGEQRHRNHQLDRDRGNHQGACGHDEPSSLAVVGVQKRASLVQLDVQMLSSNCVSGAQSSSSHNNNYDDNIDDISPTNSLSECLCCCCLHTMERTSFTSGDEDDDDGNELDDDDEEFDEDEDDGQHYANDNDHLAAVATMNELLKHQQDSAKDKPMAAAEAVAVAAVSTALSTQRPWHANDARSGPGGAGGGIRRARRNSREQTGGGLAGTAVCWQSDKLGLIQHQQSRHGLSVETRTADGSECTCKRSEGAVSQMLAAHRKLLLASQGFKGADDDDDGGLESHAFVQLQPPQPTTTLSRESTTNNTAGAATTRHLATTNRLVGGREARVGPRRAKGASSAAAMDRRSGVFLSMSSSSSASSLVVSSSSSSSRSMLAAAAVAKLEHPDGQMIEQFLELAEGQQQQAVCVRTTTASCCVEGEQKERLPEAPEATPTRISTTYSPMADGIGVDDVRASLWQSSAPNEEEEAESNEERTGAAVGPSHPARRLPTCWPAPTFAGTTTTIEISRSTSDRGRHVDTGRTSGGLANDDNDNVDSTGASANQSNANTTPMRTTGLPTLETTTNSDNGKGRHHRGQEGHLAAGDRAAQVAPGRQQQQQKQQQQQQQEEPISGTVGERYLEPGPSSNGRSLAASAASRASGIKRRFRALGQLVSFVQTSRQFNSSSSAHTSQSGAEEDDNSSMGAGGSGSGGSGSGSGSGSGAGFNHHGALEEGVSRGCSRITTTRTMTTTTTSTTMTTTTSSTARTLAMATSINQQTNIVTGAATLDNAQEAKINERHEEDGNFLSDNDGLANGARNRNNLNKSLNKNRKTLTPGLVVSISGSRHQGGDLADKLMEEPGIGPRAPQASMEHDEQQDDNQLRRKQQNLSLLVSARAVVSGHQAIAPAAKTGPLPPPSGLQPPANAARKTSAGQPRPRDQCSAQQRRQNLEMKREKKAAKTLAIITGVFVCCWLPFFLNAIVMPICGPACTPSDLILSVLLWLGYLNSLLNPIIYTIFSPDFRRAFHRLLCWPELSRPRMLINSATGSGGLSGRMALDSKYGKRRLRAANVSGGCPRQR